MNPELLPEVHDSPDAGVACFLDDFFGNRPESPVLLPISQRKSLLQESVPPDNEGIPNINPSLRSPEAVTRYPIIPSGPKTHQVPTSPIAMPGSTSVPDLTLATRAAVLNPEEEKRLVRVYERHMAQALTARCLDPNCFVDHQIGAPTSPPTYAEFRKAVIKKMSELPSKGLPPVDQPSGKSADFISALAERQFHNNVVDSVASAMLPPTPHTGGCSCCGHLGSVFYDANIPRNLALPNALLAPPADACDPGCTHHKHKKKGEGKRNKSPSD